MLIDRGFENTNENKENYDNFINKEKINITYGDRKPQSKEKHLSLLSVKRTNNMYNEILNVYIIGNEKYSKDITINLKENGIAEYEENKKNYNQTDYLRIVQLIIFNNKIVPTHIKHKNEENSNNNKTYGSRYNGCKIEFLDFPFLSINRSDNILVPKHILLTPHDIKNEVDEHYKINKLPEIKYEDPQAKYLGAEISNVIKVIRNTETAQHFSIYRRVVA